MNIKLPEKALAILTALSPRKRRHLALEAAWYDTVPTVLDSLTSAVAPGDDIIGYDTFPPTLHVALESV